MKEGAGARASTQGRAREEEAWKQAKIGGCPQRPPRADRAWFEFKKSIEKEESA